MSNVFSWEFSPTEGMSMSNQDEEVLRIKEGGLYIKGVIEAVGGGHIAGISISEDCLMGNSWSLSNNCLKFSAGTSVIEIEGTEFGASEYGMAHIHTKGIFTISVERGEALKFGTTGYTTSTIKVASASYKHVRGIINFYFEFESSPTQDFYLYWCKRNSEGGYNEEGRIEFEANGQKSFQARL